MFYREAGQFHTSYAQDSQIFPLRQDRVGMKSYRRRKRWV